jgi:hypothetical protein
MFLVFPQTKKKNWKLLECLEFDVDLILEVLSSCSLVQFNSKVWFTESHSQEKPEPQNTTDAHRHTWASVRMGLGRGQENPDA